MENAAQIRIGNRQKFYMTAFFFFFFLDKPAKRDQNPKGQVNIWEKESKVLDNQPENASKGTILLAIIGLQIVLQIGYLQEM